MLVLLFVKCYQKTFIVIACFGSCCMRVMRFVRSHCVRMLNWFDFHGHICIVFDKLGHSVYEFLVRVVVLFGVAVDCHCKINCITMLMLLMCVQVAF